MCHSVGVRRTSPSAVVTRLAARSTVKSSVSMTASFAGGVGRARTARQLAYFRVRECSKARSSSLRPGVPMGILSGPTGSELEDATRGVCSAAASEPRPTRERHSSERWRSSGARSGWEEGPPSPSSSTSTSPSTEVSPDAQSLAACRECPRVTGRALDDVPVSYPRHVVCLRNRRRLCCRRIVEIDIVADPERLRELDLTVLNH
jgi:hypothetical protein